MKIDDLHVFITLYPSYKNLNIKDAAFADLYDLLKNLGDVNTLNEIYPEEKNAKTKKFVFANLNYFIKSPDDIHEIMKIYPEEAHLELNLRQYFQQPKSRDGAAAINISMQVLGGFIAVMGCAAVAAALVYINVVSFGVGGLLVTCLGSASVLLGVGLFAGGLYKNRQSSLKELPEELVGLSI